MNLDTKNFTQVEVGPFSQYEDSTDNSTTKKFFKDLLGLTGMEISVTALPKGSQSAFFHSHKQNEELYVFVDGSGQMQLDDHLIDVKEGSMINVHPQCRRAIRANPDSQLVYLCIQAKLNSLEQYTKTDGIRHEDITWKSR